MNYLKLSFLLFFLINAFSAGAQKITLPSKNPDKTTLEKIYRLFKDKKHPNYFYIEGSQDSVPINYSLHCDSTLRYIPYQTLKSSMIRNTMIRSKIVEFFAKQLGIDNSFDVQYSGLCMRYLPTSAFSEKAKANLKKGLLNDKYKHSPNSLLVIGASGLPEAIPYLRNLMAKADEKWIQFYGNLALARLGDSVAISYFLHYDPNNRQQTEKPLDDRFM
jgi:hypothetical protein